MKFFNLLKKELRELINAQMIIGLVVSVVILLAVGNFVGGAMEEATEKSGSIDVTDNDDTDFTKELLASLKDAGFTITMHDVDTNGDPNKVLDEIDVESLIIIPEGFTETLIDNKQPVNVKLLSRMSSTAMMSSISDMGSTAIESINSIVKNKLMTEYGLSDADITTLNSPVNTEEYTVVYDNFSEVSKSQISSMTMSQSIFVPIIVFILIMFTSQMIIASISTEKIDKTLETLLSAPVSRISVLSAKMLAAATVALINAVVYMIGFSGYMGGMMGKSMDAEVLSSAGKVLTFSEIMKELGLKMTMGGYFLLGIQMFLTIMIALSVSLILGAMVNDAKSAQTIMMPVMFSAMVPYMISLFADINTLALPIKLIVWAIPFTHTFAATNNILFGNWAEFWGGLIYQVIFLCVCMFFALRLFTSDKIFTVSLNFGQKRKLKLSKHK